MYKRTLYRWLESTFSVVAERKVMLNTNVRPKMFGLDMAQKEILSHLFNPVNLTIKACNWKMVIVVTDMCGKSLLQGSKSMGLCENTHF